MFGGMFKPKDTRTPDDKYQDMKADMKTNIRGIDRQIRTLEREMKKQDLDIKKSAKTNSSRAVLQAKCKSRVMLQKGIEKLINVRANVDSLLTTITLQKAQILQVDAMKKGSMTMRLINDEERTAQLICRGMDAKDIQAAAIEFQKEMLRNDVNCGMMDDMLDGNVDEGDVDEEVDKVLLEVAGIQMKDIVIAGARKVATGAKAVNTSSNAAEMLPSVPS